MQIPLNNIPIESIEVMEDGIRAKFTPPFIRFFQTVLRAVNLWAASTSADVIVPSSGGNILISATSALLYLKPAGTLASLTVTFPDNPQDGLICTIKTTQTITALTLASTAPITILDPVTTLTTNGFVRYIYILSEAKWVRIA